jgi:hypothetical protein
MRELLAGGSQHRAPRAERRYFRGGCAGRTVGEARGVTRRTVGDQDDLRSTNAEIRAHSVVEVITMNDAADGVEEPVGTARFLHLPEPIRPEDMVTTQVTEPPPDPEGGRNTETDFMLRYGAGG